jgi:hypothetical protein
MEQGEETKGPSEEGKDAVARAIAIIEGCNPQDRGYVLNRLSQIYLGAKSAKQIRGALKSSTTSKKKSSKTSWKEQWEATTEYQEWQSHIAEHKGETPEQRAAHQETYEGLRARAFRVRDTIKSPPVDNEGGTDDEAEKPRAKGSRLAATQEASKKPAPEGPTSTKSGPYKGAYK